jgi:hypothetical protein
MSAVPAPRDFATRLAAYAARSDASPPLVVEGRLTRMVGLTLEACWYPDVVLHQRPRSSASRANGCC